MSIHKIHRVHIIHISLSTSSSLVYYKSRFLLILSLLLPTNSTSLSKNSKYPGESEAKSNSTSIISLNLRNNPIKTNLLYLLVPLLPIISRSRIVFACYNSLQKFPQFTFWHYFRYFGHPKNQFPTHDASTKYLLSVHGITIAHQMPILRWTHYAHFSSPINITTPNLSISSRNQLISQRAWRILFARIVFFTWATFIIPLHS